MRESLKDIENMVRNVPYPHPMPDALKPFHAYLIDSGHCICAIPEVMLPEAERDGELWKYKCPVPVRYVIKHGYKFYGDFLVVNVPYSNDLGVVIGAEYEEF